MFMNGVKLGEWLLILLSKIIAVNRCKEPVFLIICSSLEHVTSFKYFGVLVSSDLSWNGHIDNVVSKCNRVNGMISC